MAIKNLTHNKLVGDSFKSFSLNLKQKSILLLVSSLYASSALALEPFVIKDIRVEGIQRTEAGTVFTYLPVKVGETMNDELASQAIKSLYGTGFLKTCALKQRVTC